LPVSLPSPLPLWGGVGPSEAGVCFVVGDCGQNNAKKIESKNCSSLGYTIKKGSCPAHQVESGGSCTSGGVTYYEKCVCDPEYYKYTAQDANSKYELKEKCDKEERYARKVCRANYKFVNVTSASISAARNATLSSFHYGFETCLMTVSERGRDSYIDPNGDECSEAFGLEKVSSMGNITYPFSKYTKCECPEQYKYTDANRGEYELGGEHCTLNYKEYYESLRCPSDYLQEGLQTCADGKEKDDDSVISKSGAPTCFKCKCGSKYQYPATMDNGVVGSGNVCENLYDNYTCPSGYSQGNCPSGATCEEISLTKTTILSRRDSSGIIRRTRQTTSYSGNCYKKITCSTGYTLGDCPSGKTCTHRLYI